MEGEGESQSPLLSHLITLRIEEAIDKLKILGYEKNFCQKLKFRPIPRHYFAIATNSGEQFHAFTNLSVWLLNLCGSHLEQPQEYDDPNATIATIIAEAKKLGVPTNFPPMKLKTGSGEQVCNVLSQLVDKALERSRFSWEKPVYPEETGQEEASVQDGPEEVSLSKMEEEIQEDVDDMSDEEGGAGGGAIFLDLNLSEHDQFKELQAKEVLEDAMENTVDPEEWRQEVERVLPSLKVHYRSDNRDWRLHYEQMHNYHDNIKTVLSDTKIHLDKLHTEITKTLEKIGSREKYINQQLESQVLMFRSSQDKLSSARNEYKQSSHSVNDLSQRLAEISAQLELVKAEMDEKGTSMTDAGPVVRIKQALTKLKEECTEMDVQIGLLEHTLLDLQYKTKTAIRLQMSGGANNKKSKTLF
ncbi:PREDICTED: intraflagellar transport protein 57 homolog [Amphimedon queenslandica]|uniref:Intraflagellar transport protein 57 homolog n=1 Tax=Amphimedon queenslandica TaxID=400682 RepID=A0A1X7VR10_AMPQE|nr:PREDICTED: intraflagellar transport protein 57 homolog [Amphimedon queenslandica]|eukprot:XP_019858121.1 PREDICTED: intraflagellar transport protein 57 homolog [Amphimedon queenslandica]